MYLLLSSYTKILMDIEKCHIRDVSNDVKHLTIHLSKALLNKPLKDLLVEELDQLNNRLQLNTQDIGTAYPELFDQLLLIYYQGLSPKERKQAQPLPFSILERILIDKDQAKLANQGVKNFVDRETYLASDPDNRRGVQVYKLRDKMRVA